MDLGGTTVLDEKMMMMMMMMMIVMTLSIKSLSTGRVVALNGSGLGDFLSSLYSPTTLPQLIPGIWLNT